MAAAPKAKASDWYRVKESFHAARPGFTGSMMQGELVRGSHAAVKDLPQYFERLDGVERPDVESATAAPGEKR